jgi:hypothetical protein
MLQVLILPECEMVMPGCINLTINGRELKPNAMNVVSLLIRMQNSKVAVR